MRIIIVDDENVHLRNIGDTLSEMGHEVMGMLIESSSDVKIDGLRWSTEIKSFNPDKIFLDHSFRRDDLDGEKFASLCELSPEKLIGTSTSFKQEYCAGGHWWGKGYGQIDEEGLSSFLS